MTIKATHPGIATIAFVACCTGLAAQAAPSVMVLDPPHLAYDIDARTKTELVVQFDRDMDTSGYAVCGGGPGFPKVINVAWRGRRKFVIETELEADRIYSMDLSCEASTGFRSAEGVRLEPVPWRFATNGPEVAEAMRDQIATRLFRALRDRYSYRDRLGIDWADFEQRSYDSIIEAPHMAAIALRITEVLATPQDPHISVRWLDATIPTFQRSAASNFDAKGVQKVIKNLSVVGRIGLQGRTDDNIGYLMVGSFDQQSSRDFELCIRALRDMGDCKAVVIDVRSNGGGDENLARRLAGFFIEDQKVYAAHRNRDARVEGGFGPRQERVVRANPAPDVYAGPVAVLQGQLNMSSCEAFLLMMKQARRAILVGETSYGSSGNPKPVTLETGLSVLLPSWQALRPDGSCFEGEGIEPTVPIPTSPDSLGHSDLVLEEALQRLRGSR